MDLVTTRIYETQPAAVTRREEAAQPNGKSSVANMVDRFEAATRLTIPRARRPLVENAVHYLLGAVPGAVYGVVRRPLGAARLWEGAAYGLAVFAEGVDAPSAVGRFVHVYVDPGTRRPVPVPDVVRDVASAITSGASTAG